MAAQTRELYNSGSNGAASISMTFNDANGSISRLAWTVNSGHLTGVVRKAGMPDIVFDQTTSGSINPPAGYDLVRNARGGWSFSGDISYEIVWHE